MGKVQRYWIEFSSRARKEVSVESKHATFFEGLKNLAEPWGLGGRQVPPVPKFNGGMLATCSLTRFLRVSSADIMYEYRWNFPDDSLYDDRLVVIFRTDKADLNYLIYEVIPTYLEAFDTYRLEYFDDALLFSPVSKPAVRLNLRYTVDRVGPISFFDDGLCQRAFGLRASAVVDLFRDKIEHSTMLYNGAYLVGSSEVLSFEESERLAKKMWQHLAAHRKR